MVYLFLGLRKWESPKSKRGLEKQRLKGKTVRLAEEVRYIQRRARQYDARIVTLGQVVLFSTETGDAWLLDPSDQLATPVARDGDPLPVHIEETDTNFAIAWTGAYRIDGPAFVYFENDSGKLRTILGYPTHRITQEISKMLG